MVRFITPNAKNAITSSSSIVLIEKSWQISSEVKAQGPSGQGLQEIPEGAQNEAHQGWP